MEYIIIERELESSRNKPSVFDLFSKELDIKLIEFKKEVTKLWECSCSVCTSQDYV